MKRLPSVPPPRPHLDHLDHTGMTGLMKENWRLRAACQSADPDLFFPVSSTGKSLEQAVDAKALCARCLVRRECLAFALRTRQVHGIWGGMTEEERNRPIPQPRADRDELMPPATA
jgi:WhiB family transcriptional regulator, redox-sensing transcriptional regulator